MSEGKGGEERDEVDEEEGGGGGDELIAMTSRCLVVVVVVVVGNGSPRRAASCGPDSIERRRRFRLRLRLRSRPPSSSAINPSLSPDTTFLSCAVQAPDPSSSSISSPSRSPTRHRARDTNGDADAVGDEDGRVASSVRVDDSEKRGVGANWEEEARWTVRSEEGGGRGWVRKRWGEGVWGLMGVSVEWGWGWSGVRTNVGGAIVVRVVRAACWLHCRLGGEGWWVGWWG